MSAAMDRALQRLSEAAADVVSRQRQMDASRYDLGQLIPGRPTACVSEHRKIDLEAALESERQRGREGHWTYDECRLVTLLQLAGADPDSSGGSCRSTLFIEGS